jgi:hypothetical protein
MNRRDKENCLAALYKTLADFSDQAKLDELELNEDEIDLVKSHMVELMVLISKLESDLAE